jgi:hypothetical protein
MGTALRILSSQANPADSRRHVESIRVFNFPIKLAATRRRAVLLIGAYGSQGKLEKLHATRRSGDTSAQREFKQPHLLFYGELWERLVP